MYMIVYINRLSPVVNCIISNLNTHSQNSHLAVNMHSFHICVYICAFLSLYVPIPCLAKSPKKCPPFLHVL